MDHIPIRNIGRLQSIVEAYIQLSTLQTISVNAGLKIVFIELDL